MALRLRAPGEADPVGPCPGSTLLIVTMLCVLFIGGAVAARHAAPPGAPTTTSIASAPIAEPPPAGETRLRLPGGGEATLSPGPPQDQDALPFAPEPDHALWWGPSPAEAVGVTVVACRARYHGRQGVFEALYQVTEGESVTVTGPAGDIGEFTVTEVGDVSRGLLSELIDERRARRGVRRLILVTSREESATSPTSGHSRVVTATVRNQ